jgi:hypothetical protein
MLSTISPTTDPSFEKTAETRVNRAYVLRGVLELRGPLERRSDEETLQIRRRRSGLASMVDVGSRRHLPRIVERLVRVRLGVDDRSAGGHKQPGQSIWVMDRRESIGSWRTGRLAKWLL